MSSRKRISEWAKEWGIDSKEILARLEKQGIHSRKPQSAMTEDEAARVHADLGLTEKPAVSVGEERVVEEVGQTVVERRVRANVIRRRTTKHEEELEPPLAPPIPPPVDLLSSSVESLEAFVPASPSQVAVEPLTGSAAEVRPPLPPLGHFETPPLPIEPSPAEAAPAAPAEIPVEAREAAGAAAEARAPGQRPPLSEGPQGPKVLGRIDLKKAEAARQAERAAAQRRATPPAPAAVVPPPEGGEEEAKPGQKRKKRRVIKKAELAEIQERAFRPGKMLRKKRAQPGKEQQKTEITTPKASKRVVRISEVITVGDLAKAMGVKAGEIIKKLMDNGMMSTINQVLDADTATLIATEFDYNVENVAFDAEQAIEEGHEAQPDEAQTLRPPVVTIMGHVDHGKTSLLDAIRETNVTAQEAGGITQHIGAYSVPVSDKRVTFLDTPGHEAFTAMRARGAKVTDIVVLVVAADDSVMPQTVEAINHARAAEVPILVAVNKIDKPEANLERVKQALADHGLAPEDWGGDTICVPVSAKTREGIPHLLEMLLLQADVLELKANADKLARGTIVEARLDRGRGPVATVLVQEGTLKVGDPFVCGGTYGRVRAMMDDKGQKVEIAGPSTPVEILGLQAVPEAGHSFVVTADEAMARQVADHRRDKQRETELIKSSKVSLEDLYQQIQAGDVKELRVILKADVQGSVEALAETLRRLSTDEVRLHVIHASVGGISESDVLLATASNAIIIGFNVRPESKANDVAEREGVEIRLYTVIYEAVNDVRDAMEGLLEPMLREKTIGRAEVRQVFTIGSYGTIAGSFVIDGKITRGASVRLVRDHVVVHNGKIGSLRRFKEDAREVLAGYECGIGLENYSDLKVGDIIEPYETERVIRRLTPAVKGSGVERRV